MIKKVCFITGTRAEYGLLKNLMKAVSGEFKMSLVVTGTHLSAAYGLTYQQIEQDGFTIDKKIDILLSSGTETAIAKSVGLATISMAEALSDLSPDLVVLVGDRYEILAAAQTCLILKIPVAHIHGGETTEGAIDEAIRHSITKMSHLHFVTNEQHKKRVIQLGEQPTRVHCVGAPGVENARLQKLLSLAELSQQIQFPLKENFFLITYHPATLVQKSIELEMQELLSALNEFPDHSLLFTMPNADAHSHLITQAIKEFCTKHKSAVLVPSLGQERYLSAIKLSQVVVGNSSSGLIEAPFYKKATVNIGDRQKGRASGTSVINCEVNSGAIKKSLLKAISPEFKKTLDVTVSVYGDGHTTDKIMKVLKAASLENILMKKFFDIQVGDL